MNTMRFQPYLGIIAALTFFIVVAVFLPRAFSPSTSTSPTASSTLAVVPGFSVPATSASPTSPVQTPKETAPTLAAPKKSAPSVPPATTQPASTTSLPVTSPAPPALSDNAALDASASALRGALVNIMCYVPAGSSLHSVSGSGVIIDPKGIILTNAHVAQYFLLANRDVSCVIRSGSPAADAYDASPIFISPAWIAANPNVLTESTPTGTGEHDFAFLAVTSSATSSALPSPFSSIPLAMTPPHAGTPVVIASYGAQFLTSAQIQSSLYPTIVFGSVKDVYTFGTNTIDVLALGGSAAAQEGSSGGGVANAAGDLAGIITTSTVSGDTSSRSLDGITASYIRADYASEMGTALDVLLSRPTSTSVADFAPQIPKLESIITAGLN